MCIRDRFYRVRADVEVLHIRRAERDSATGDGLEQIAIKESTVL